MKITEFKQGDFITRTESAKSGDNSYQGECFELIGFSDAKIVLIRHQRWGEYDEASIKFMDFDCYKSGWERFPMEELSKASQKLIQYAEMHLEVFKVDDKELGEELLPNTLVITCDNRWGIVKEVDLHSMKFLKRKDYKVEFPDGVGIFRRDELKPMGKVFKNQ